MSRRAPGQLRVLLASFALFAVACAEPVIPAIDAPATVTPTPAPTPTAAPTVENQPTPTPPPFAGEPGITADELRVGVIYDVGVDPVTDQISLSALQAVQAWAESVNADGGLALRTVVVEPIETRPLLEDHAEAIDRACNSDLFALVGSSARFDGLGVEQLESCLLPDYPANANSIDRIESAVTTLSNPITGNLWQAGWAANYAENQPEAAVAAATLLLDLPVSIADGERMIEAASAQGMEFVARPQISIDTDFAAVVEELDQAGTELVIWRADSGRLLELLQAFDDADVARPQIDCAQGCYSDVWISAAEQLGNEVSIWLPHVPLEESFDSPELNRYLFWLGLVHGVDHEPTSTGIMAWSAGLLFEAAVDIATGVGTPDYDPNNLTRSGVLAATETITEWDANGVHGLSNPADGTPSACYLAMTLSGGAWERSYPLRSGVLDCEPENLVELTLTAGAGAAPDPTATPVEPPDDEG